MEKSSSESTNTKDLARCLGGADGSVSSCVGGTSSASSSRFLASELEDVVSRKSSPPPHSLQDMTYSSSPESSPSSSSSSSSPSSPGFSLPSSLRSSSTLVDSSADSSSSSSSTSSSDSSSGTCPLSGGGG